MVELSKINYELNINYEKLIGSSWAKKLGHILESDYMKNLMLFLHEVYKVENVRPRKSNVFNTFKNTKFEDVRVVIIGREPYNNMKSIGIPFANEDKYGSRFSPELLKIHTTIEKTVYEGFHMYMDPTFSDLGSQGVLMLDSAFTSVEGLTGAHLKYWRNFNREIIKLINEYKTGVVFCLWGKEAAGFKKYIKANKNYVLTCEHPEDAVDGNREWNCDHFEKTNAILEMLNGYSDRITW